MRENNLDVVFVQKYTFDFPAAEAEKAKGKTVYITVLSKSPLCKSMPHITQQ